MPKETSILSDKKEVTVVMAVKNEAKNIKKTLNEFFNQTYKNVKFIIVDDNSCDETASFIKSSELFSTGKLRLLSATGTGKKQAIQQAILEANTEIILTADADVSYPNTWVSTMVNSYIQSDADLIIGPVKMSKSYPLQCMEYLSIMGITAGSAGNNNPLMCNACSMAFA